jgi:hypothetical protein
MEEGGFVNLMEYATDADSLKPTDTLLSGESFVLNEIAKRVPTWSGRWDLVWENILLRGRVLQTILEIANQTGKKNLLEAETTVKSNQMFHAIAERTRQEVGTMESQRIYDEWLEWFKKKIS